MARLTAPLLSFEGSGAIAKTQVYSRWRGIPYARRYVIPANPKTAGQELTRNVFAWLNGVYKQLAAGAISPWQAAANGQPFLPRNKFISANLPAIRTANNNTGFVGSPGALGGFALSAISASASSGTVSVSETAPALPPSWAVASYNALLVSSESDFANPVTAFQSFFGTGSSSPVSINSVPAGTYIVTGWATYTRPDNLIAYGPAIETTVTVS